MAMPSGAKWVQLAKQVAAGTASDDEVCSFKLNFSVLEKLPLDFVAAAYEEAANSYRAISGSSNTEKRQQAKSVYIAEKRKVLSALATTLKQKDNSAVDAEGSMLQLPASASESLPTPVPAPIVSAVVAEEAEEVSDNFLMVHSSGLVWTVVFSACCFYSISLVYRFAQLICRSWLLNCRIFCGTIWLVINLPGAPSGAS